MRQINELKDLIGLELVESNGYYSEAVDIDLYTGKDTDHSCGMGYGWVSL